MDTKTKVNYAVAGGAVVLTVMAPVTVGIGLALLGTLKVVKWFDKLSKEEKK